MNGVIGRLEILALLVCLVGLYFFVRCGRRLIAAIRARATYGAPYLEGMVMDRFLSLLMASPLLVVGLGLAFFAMAQASFQPDGERVRVGRIEARRAGWGRTSVQFSPDPGYPGRAVLEAEISGSRWAVAGDFVHWDPAVHWLGLRSGHRMRYLLGTVDPSGLSKDDGSGTVVLESLPAAAAALVAAAPWLPWLEVSTGASQWIRPADFQVVDIHAGPHGYLADIAAEGRAAR